MLRQFISRRYLTTVAHYATKSQSSYPTSTILLRSLFQHQNSIQMQMIRSFASDTSSSVSVEQQDQTSTTPSTDSTSVQEQQGFGSGRREGGTVKWFDASKGFGFIVREQGDDIFVHFSGIRGTGYRTLEEGQRVEFIIASGHKGPVAQDVTLKQ